MLLDLMMRGPAILLFGALSVYLYAREQKPAAPLVAVAAGVQFCALAAFYGVLSLGSTLLASGLGTLGTAMMRAFDQAGAFLCFGLVLFAFSSLPERARATTSLPGSEET